MILQMHERICYEWRKTESWYYAMIECMPYLLLCAWPTLGLGRGARVVSFAHVDLMSDGRVRRQ